MKERYLQFSLLLVFVYISWNQQFAMARHAHHHRTQNSNDCYRCPPGYGMERHCNRLHDTKCGACAPDHYSSHFSARKPCYPCSRCGTGLYVAHRCTASRDTICDSCHTYKGPHNENFYERCVKPLFGGEGNDSDAIHGSQADIAKKSLVAMDLTSGVSSSVIIASCVAIGGLAVLLLATCWAVSSRYRCRRVNQRFHYEAVATKDAVML